MTDDHSTAGRKPPETGPSPTELAEEGRGREPAPLGANDESPDRPSE